MLRLRPLLAWLVPAAAVLTLWILFPEQVKLVLQLSLGGYVIAFLLEPLVEKLELHMKEKYAVLLSVAIGALLLIGILLLFLPPIVRQVAELVQSWPQFSQKIEQMMTSLSRVLERMGLPAIPLSNMDMSFSGERAAQILSGTFSAAGNIVSAITKLGLSVILGVYFLLDRKQLSIRMELVIPSAVRPVVLKMGTEVSRGIRTYLRAQVTIALIVGTLAGLGLWAVGVNSALALGSIVGIFNMIPYFGPILGAIPAVLTALSQGIWTALFALLVLFVLQQMDGMFISPRVMGGITGVSPACVLLALTIGSSGWGVVGMLFALPVALIVRICFRVWVSRNEMIEKPPEL